MYRRLNEPPIPIMRSREVFKRAHLQWTRVGYLYFPDACCQVCAQQHFVIYERLRLCMS